MSSYSFSDPKNRTKLGFEQNFRSFDRKVSPIQWTKAQISSTYRNLVNRLWESLNNLCPLRLFNFWPYLSCGRRAWENAISAGIWEDIHATDWLLVFFSDRFEKFDFMIKIIKNHSNFQHILNFPCEFSFVGNLSNNLSVYCTLQAKR